MRVLRNGLIPVLVATMIGILTTSHSSTAVSVTAITPQRVLDSRAAGVHSGIVLPGRTVRVEMPTNIANSAEAVALNLTATGAIWHGHVTAWPCDEPVPQSSVINFRRGQTIANLAMLRLGGGAVCLRSSAPVHLVADLMGSFSGRSSFVGTSPNRITDTRTTRNPLRAGEVRRIEVAGTAGVDGAAMAAAVNVTVVAPRKSGYLSMTSCDASGVGKPGKVVPKTSTMNFVKGETIANMSMAGLTDGALCIVTTTDADVLVDTYGWTPPGGRLHVQDPVRILDSRARLGTATAVRPGEVVRLRVAGRGGAAVDASGALLTLTAVSGNGSGHVTVWPCNESMPDASVVNFTKHAARTNLAFVKVDPNGDVCLRVGSSSKRPMHLIGDVVGWISDPVTPPPTTTAPTTTVPATTAPTTTAPTTTAPATTAPATTVPATTAPTTTPPTTRPPTTTTPATTAPTTTTPTTTVPPTAPPTTRPPTTTTPATTAPPTTSPVTTVPPTGVAFIETFDDNQGLERFRTGVFHRDIDAQGWGSNTGSWQADHNIHLGPDNCGNPDDGHTHTVTKANRAGANYVCRDHWMTSMGDVDGYSIVWGSPNRTFNGQTRVAWDVNSTNLGGRQWWEVAIVPANAPDTSCIDWLPCDVPGYPTGAVVIGTRDGQPRVWANGREVDATWQTMCRDGQQSLDLTGCASKSIRRPWSVTDNRNGTLTVRFNQYQWTVSGAFPPGDWKVVFKDHNYTPNKDGVPPGHTWHWDNIVVSS